MSAASRYALSTDMRYGLGWWAVGLVVLLINLL